MIWEEKTHMIYTTDGSLKCILIEKKEACYPEHGNLSRSMPLSRLKLISQLSHESDKHKSQVSSDISGPHLAI